ncbi:MAG: ATP synthase F0 subunit B [bacterium]|nr:ATP synthase F0 subunit B [bacterium]
MEKGIKILIVFAMLMLIPMLVAMPILAGGTTANDQQTEAGAAHGTNQDSAHGGDSGGHGDDSGGHGDDSDHHFSWTKLFGSIFNSTVLFGGLIFFLRKPIINLLAQKSLDIETDIKQREELVETTTSRLHQMKTRLEKIESEVMEMKEDAKKSGSDEQKRLKETGEKEKQRILELTEEEINTRVDTSVRNLKEKIADLTIDHFKKDIQAHMNKKNHNNIIEKNIEICGDIIERE